MRAKAALRAEMRRLKAAMTAEERWREAVAAWQRIEAMACFGSWQHILLYHSLPDELDSHEAVCRWAALGKQVYLPVVVGDELVIRRYEPTAMRQGAYGIWEPVGEDVPAERMEAVIVPGVAFDAKGNRLGRGKGYYDRLLCACPAVRVGVCYECQMVGELPAEPHDCRMHYVATASSVRTIEG